MILMKIFINFYESREKVREEDVDVWGEEAQNMFMSLSISVFLLYIHIFFYVT
jgi:hypothetical protein